MNASLLFFGRLNREGLDNYEAGFPLTHIDPSSPEDSAYVTEKYRTDLLTAQERCILRQYTTMENMTKQCQEQEREEKQLRLNLQLTARTTESPRFGLLDRFRKERIESGRKYDGYAMHRRNYNNSPGEAMSAPEMVRGLSEPESQPDMSVPSSPTEPSSSRWRKVLPVSYDRQSNVILNKSYRSPDRSPLHNSSFMSPQIRRSKLTNVLGESLLQSPVGQHTHNYRYVMRNLAPDIHRLSIQSRHLDSTTASSPEIIASKADTAHVGLVSTIMPKVLTTSATPLQRSFSQRLPTILTSPQMTQSNGTWKSAHPHLSAMHPITRKQSVVNGDVLTVKPIALSDLKIEDLKI